jgi:hypothetical protein
MSVSYFSYPISRQLKSEEKISVNLMLIVVYFKEVGIVFSMVGGGAASLH